MIRESSQPATPTVLRRRLSFICRASLVLAAAAIFGGAAGAGAAEPVSWYEIDVIDAATGRGIPLVELETVHHVRHITDNAGRIAFFEPGLMSQTIFFEIHAPGYEIPKDGFGFAGVRLNVEGGQLGTIKLNRVNIAERLYRCTGQGLYRDTILLGKPAPLASPLGMGFVSGQDSVQMVPYRGKLFWFWGDTSRLSYPLGLFRTSGATSAAPGEGGTDPAVGINFAYFTGKDGFSRAMVDVPDPKGVVWIDGVCAVPDEGGRERLVAHFDRREGLESRYEHGLVVYNDEREIFEVRTTLEPLRGEWRFPRSHPIRGRDADAGSLFCGGPFPLTRVPATLAAVSDPASYQSWSCADPAANPANASLRRTADGALDWKWQPGPPISPKDEKRWLDSGLIKGDEARFLPEDTGHPGRRITLHGGTVNWNPFRKRWIFVGNEISSDKASPSMLGEVWYSESESPQGPWLKAVRLVTHDKHSFYNPCHHTAFDQDGGRIIYFEGTYTNMFTNAQPTQRYDYNQVMYRVALDHPAIRAAFPGRE